MMAARLRPAAETGSGASPLRALATALPSVPASRFQGSTSRVPVTLSSPARLKVVRWYSGAVSAR